VVRGSKIGIFNNASDELQFNTVINKVSTPNGKEFFPEKIMLHEQDSSLVLMNKKNPNSLFRMDLEYGKIVEEWDIDENRQITDFTPDMKYSQLTPQKTFVGVSHNAVFRIDPRLPNKKLVDSQMNQYKSKNEFRCVATTGKGHLVVASDKGELRLYDKIDKRAKTLIPGLGDPILGVDVTEDGSYILATCKTYLLLISTNPQDEVKGGFEKSLGANILPPIRLQLMPQHVAWMNTNITFTVARFNTNVEGKSRETTIVTSTGPYVITWGFSKVKSGKLYGYTIKKYPDNIVADNFTFGSDKNVIVALPDDVSLIQKNQFLSPKRAFSKNDIVNSPF